MMQSLQRMKNKGFTLIELVMVLVLLSILVAVAIPKYEDLSGGAKTAAKAATAGAVRSAYAIYLAANKANPTVTQLASALVGSGCSAAATGISCTLKDGTTTFIVLTYTDAGCTTATAAVGNAVACVGNPT